MALNNRKLKRTSKKKIKKSIKRKTRRSSKKKTRKSIKRKTRKSIKRKTRRFIKKKRGGNLQPQMYKMDCVIATLSSLTDVDYEEIKSNFKGHDFDKEGLYNKDIKRMLDKYGVKWENINYLPKDNRAIVDIISLNYPPNKHVVYWDGREIFDPNIRNQGIDSTKKLYNTTKIKEIEKNKKLYNVWVRLN